MSTRIPNSPSLILAAPQWEQCSAGLPPFAGLSARTIGTTVTDHRSSWVRRLPAGCGDVFVKTYHYSTWRSRLKDFGKRTAPWVKSRARREFDALAWLRAAGLPGPLPLLLVEWRRWSWLERATLVTTAFPGRPADTVLAEAGSDERRAIGGAIGAFVHHVHQLGFRDRNLDLRNLLIERTPDGFRVAKIDSPRHRLRRPGSSDRLVRADWDRLLPQLGHFGIAATAFGAAPLPNPR